MRIDNLLDSPGFPKSLCSKEFLESAYLMHVFLEEL